MGDRGPVPKRSDQRVRRNKDEGSGVEKIAAKGVVYVPELGFDDPHSITTDLYRSLTESAQARFFEPSDWQLARYTLHFADRLLKSERPNGQILATVFSSFSDLLMSEGARRRLKLEIERNGDQPDGEVIDVVDRFKQMLAERAREDQAPEGSSAGPLPPYSPSGPETSTDTEE